MQSVVSGYMEIGLHSIKTEIVTDESLDFQALVSKLPYNFKVCIPTTVRSKVDKTFTKTYGGEEMISRAKFGLVLFIVIPFSCK